MFRRIVFTAAFAGLIAGLVLTGIQFVRVIPLLHEAEIHEGAAHSSAQPDSFLVFRRAALTALTNVVTAIGFGLLLSGGLALHGRADLRHGLLWGLGGFAAFSAAPALGLPPELPGTIAAGLIHRQTWWLGTVAATSVGLALIAFAPGALWKLVGAVLIALPHLIGAPQPARHGGTASEALQRQFVVAALAASGIFWLLLGGLCGALSERIGRD